MGLPRDERGSGQVRGLTWHVSTCTSHQTVMQLELGMSHQLTAGVHLTELNGYCIGIEWY